MGGRRRGTGGGFGEGNMHEISEKAWNEETSGEREKGRSVKNRGKGVCGQQERVVNVGWGDGNGREGEKRRGLQ
jgi:hypothetical protein